MLPIRLRNTVETHHRCEVFDHPYFISYLASWVKPNLYVEYGIRDGTNVMKVAPYCKEVWGVDVADTDYKSDNFKFFKQDTRSFKKVLESKRPIIDMAFIDACHECNTVVQDFDDIFPYIIEDGFIFLHDTYPISEYFLNPNYCNDCWKVPDILKNKYGANIELLTIPIQPGLTIVKKIRNSPSWRYP